MKKRVILILAICLAVVLLLVGDHFLYRPVRNYNDSKALVKAIKNNDIPAAEKIIKRNPQSINTYPSITTQGWEAATDLVIMYPLTEACAADNIEMVELLLQYGADPNCNDGLTPLSVTYSNKRSNWYAISKILIAHGATLDYATQFYSEETSSILQDIVEGRATPDKEEEVIAAFLYAVENCNHDKVDWNRVLQHSVGFNRIEIVKFLLDEGYCSANDTSSGYSPLMYANTAEMVQLLLDYGADKTFKSTIDGMTAYDRALKNHPELAELLKTPDQ